MTDERSLEDCVDELSAHPKRRELAAVVRRTALGAARARRSDAVARPAAEAGAQAPEQPSELTREDAATPLGNVLEVLERGAQTPSERRLLGALLALGIADAFPEEDGARNELAADLVWLEAHTAVRALGALDKALAEQSGAIWEAAARIAREPSAAALDFGRTEALVAAVALCESRSEVARRARIHLAQNAGDPLLRGLVVSSLGGAETSELKGELSPPPFGPLLTAVLAATLLLFLYQGLRLVGRVVFAYRRPASLRLSSNGLELNHRTELMGKVLRERAVVVPLSNLVRVTREVRYARAGLYAGLTALVLGTYFGMGLFVDGLRVPGGSAQLVSMAVLLIVIGLGLDFVFSNAADSARGRCRVVVVQRKGRPLCVGALDPLRADAMLANIAEAARS